MAKDRTSATKTIVILYKSFKISLASKSNISKIVSLLGFPAAFLPCMIAITLQHFTDQVHSLYRGDVTQISHIIIALVVLSVLYIIQTGFTCIQSYFTSVETLKVNMLIKERIIGYNSSVKYKYINNYDNYKEKIGFASGYAGIKVAGSIQSIITWLHNAITFISILLVLIQVDILMVVAIAISCVPATVFACMQSEEDYAFAKRQMNEDLMVMNDFAQLSGPKEMMEIRFWGIAEYLKKQWLKDTKTYITAKNRMNIRHGLYNLVADAIKNVFYIVFLLIAAHSVWEEPTQGIGTFMLVFTLTGQFQNAISDLLTGIIAFFKDINYMRDFFALDMLERDDMNMNCEPLTHVNIRFNDVSFSYPNTDRQVLKNISVTINQGEKIAIVGENGSGKSTFVNLLCGLYEPDDGNIYINGCSIDECLPELRESVSAVFQDVGHYEGTFRDNITLSDTQRGLSDTQLDELCSYTGLKEIVYSQPNKYDEVLGTMNLVGKNLSVGQWQRIAITRALYRNKSKLLILDEPTASLDPAAESALYGGFSSLTEDKTTILITHRLGAAKVVDRILVFEEGQIVEDGSHEELMQREGIYAKMYHAQAHWYE